MSLSADRFMNKISNSPKLTLNLIQSFLAIKKQFEQASSAEYYRCICPACAQNKGDPGSDGSFDTLCRTCMRAVPTDIRKDIRFSTSDIHTRAVAAAIVFIRLKKKPSKKMAKKRCGGVA